jgi:hypothetical protein
LENLLSIIFILFFVNSIRFLYFLNTRLIQIMRKVDTFRGRQLAEEDYEVLRSRYRRPGLRLFEFLPDPKDYAFMYRDSEFADLRKRTRLEYRIQLIATAVFIAAMIVGVLTGIVGDGRTGQ